MSGMSVASVSTAGGGRSRRFRQQDDDDEDSMAPPAPRTIKNFPPARVSVGLGAVPPSRPSASAPPPPPPAYRPTPSPGNSTAPVTMGGSVYCEARYFLFGYDCL